MCRATFIALADIGCIPAVGISLNTPGKKSIEVYCLNQLTGSSENLLLQIETLLIFL